MGIIAKIKHRSAWITSIGMIVYFVPIILNAIKVYWLPNWVSPVGAGLVVLGTILYFKR